MDAFASSAFAWAARAAPVNCDSYREVVARYDAAVGRYGADGARAARVWARLERFLADAAPTVADTLMAGWRAEPPPAAVDPAVRLCPAVAASAALHLGQVTTGGSAAAWVRSRLVGLVEVEGEGVWEGGGDLTSDVVRAAIHRRRLAAECAGVAGVVTVYDQLHSGFLHPLWCHDAGLEADRWAEVGMPSALSAETPAERFRPPAFQWGPRPDEFCTFVGVTPGPGGAGTCVGAPLDPAALRPLLVPAPGTALDGLAPPAAQRGRSLFVCLRTGAVYGRAAAVIPPPDRPGRARLWRAAGGGARRVGARPRRRRPGPAGLAGGVGRPPGGGPVRGRVRVRPAHAARVGDRGRARAEGARRDGGDGGLPGRLPRVREREGEGRGGGGDGGGTAARARARARAPSLLFSLSQPSHRPSLSLSFPPSLPLASGLGPAALASLAAAWPDAGVGVSLTGGVLQIVAATAYSVGGVGPGAGKHEWAYQLTVRLLGGEATATAAQGAAGGSGGAEAWPTDEQGTWPPHLHAGEDEEGEDGEALPAPLPPGGLPPWPPPPCSGGGG